MNNFKIDLSFQDSILLFICSNTYSSKFLNKLIEKFNFKFLIHPYRILKFYEKV